MKPNYELQRTGSAAPGGFSDFEAATRYLKGRDWDVIRKDDPDYFTFPKSWDLDMSSVKARSGDLRDHNKTLLRADFERATEAEDTLVLPARQTASQEVLKTARSNMARYQLHHCGVLDERILEAFREVPRDQFIPGMEGQTVAYVDTSLSLGNGRWSMEPRVLARMIQEAEIKEDSYILDMGCGTGYSTAILSKLGGYVTGVDNVGTLTMTARKLMQENGCYNTNIVTHNLNHLKTLESEYDVYFIHRYDFIFITGGAVTHLPPHIKDKLKEGGKIFAVVKEDDSPFTPGKVKVFLKVNGQLSSYPLLDAQVPLMPDLTYDRPFLEKFMAGRC